MAVGKGRPDGADPGDSVGAGVAGDDRAGSAERTSVADDADGVDDHIDACEPRQPGIGIKITSEIGRHDTHTFWAGGSRPAQRAHHLVAGIRQTLDNQRPEFIRHFFTTVQITFAGNDSEGLRYAPIIFPKGP